MGTIPKQSPQLDINDIQAPVDNTHQAGTTEKSSVEERAKQARKHQEELLDETVEESFPASDPPSRTPIVGH